MAQSLFDQSVSKLKGTRTKEFQVYPWQILQSLLYFPRVALQLSWHSSPFSLYQAQVESLDVFCFTCNFIICNLIVRIILSLVLWFLFQTKFNERGMYYVFNHVDIKIKYYDGSGEDWEGARLTSAEVKPKRYELHKQQCQRESQWSFGPCAELDSWVKRSGSGSGSGSGICDLPCSLCTVGVWDTELP